ncbi:MAG: MFS transporter [Turicibacter sp.]|nr:MFS transporter [Turicibacter sp.]
MKKKQTSLQLILITLFWLIQYIHVPFQVIFLSENGVSLEVIGQIVGIYGLAQLFLRLPVGIGADRKINHRVFIITGLACAGLGTFLRFASPTATGFLVANMLSGAGSAMWVCFMVHYMSYFGQEEQQIATGKLIFANTLGIMLAFLTATFFYPILGLRLLALIGFLFSIVGVLLGLRLEKSPDKFIIPSVGSLLGVISQKKLLIFSLLALVQQGIQMSTVMSFTTQVIRQLGGGNALVGWSTIIFMVSSAVSAKLSTWSFFNRYFKKSLVVASLFLLTALYSFVVVHTGNWGVLLVLQIIPGLSAGVMLPMLISESMDGVSPEKRSTAMGYFQSIYALGMVLFPFVSGLISESRGLPSAFLFLLSAALVGAVVSMIYYYGGKMSHGN